MATREDSIIRTAAIAKEFGLMEPLAREMVMDKTQRALRRSAFALLFLFAGPGLAGWFYTSPETSPSAAVWILLGTVSAWLSVGRSIAKPAVRGAKAGGASPMHGLRSYDSFKPNLLHKLPGFRR